MARVGGEVGEGKTDRLLPARQHRPLPSPQTPSSTPTSVNNALRPVLPPVYQSLPVTRYI